MTRHRVPAATRPRRSESLERRRTETPRGKQQRHRCWPCLCGVLFISRPLKLELLSSCAPAFWLVPADTQAPKSVFSRPVLPLLGHWHLLIPLPRMCFLLTPAGLSPLSCPGPPCKRPCPYAPGHPASYPYLTFHHPAYCLSPYLCTGSWYPSGTVVQVVPWSRAPGGGGLNSCRSVSPNRSPSEWVRLEKGHLFLSGLCERAPVPKRSVRVAAWEKMTLIHCVQSAAPSPFVKMALWGEERGPRTVPGPYQMRSQRSRSETWTQYRHRKLRLCARHRVSSWNNKENKKIPLPIPQNRGTEPLHILLSLHASVPWGPTHTRPFPPPFPLSPKPQVTAPPPDCSSEICPLTVVSLLFLQHFKEQDYKSSHLPLFCASVKTRNDRISLAQKVTLNKTPPAINEQFVIWEVFSLITACLEL